jgi:hypothetical protein
MAPLLLCGGFCAIFRKKAQVCGCCLTDSDKALVSLPTDKIANLRQKYKKPSPFDFMSKFLKIAVILLFMILFLICAIFAQQAISRSR